MSPIALFREAGIQHNQRLSSLWSFHTLRQPLLAARLQGLGLFDEQAVKINPSGKQVQHDQRYMNLIGFGPNSLDCKTMIDKHFKISRIDAVTSYIV